ncbi:unnamed protein product [Closterium sp. NIES-65]|nr:unnamed protein product [Closterium sp. NIES-65]
MHAPVEAWEVMMERMVGEVGNEKGVNGERERGRQGSIGEEGGGGKENDKGAKSGAEAAGEEVGMIDSLFLPRLCSPFNCPSPLKAPPPLHFPPPSQPPSTMPRPLTPPLTPPSNALLSFPHPSAALVPDPFATPLQLLHVPSLAALNRQLQRWD